MVAVPRPECGGTPGGARLEINGGIGPYTQTWTEGVDPANLMAGTYQVEVADTSGYKAFTEVEITRQDSSISVLLTTLEEPTCTTPGSVSWEVSGSEDVTAIWTSAGGDSIITANPVSLGAGTFYLEVTENTTGCIAMDTISLTPIDTIAPVLENLPANTLVYACGDKIPAAPDVTAKDACDGEIEVDTTETMEENKTIRTWTAKDAAGNTASFTQVIECPTGIENNPDHKKLIVYPIPSPDKIVNFEINLNKPRATLLVYDMVGRLLLKEEVHTGAVHTINFKGYRSGAYMAKVYNENEVIIKRFVIE